LSARSDANSAEYRDHHATIFVSPAASGAIEAIRREWDPAMASRIAAHVTLAYPREAPMVDMLFERVREACHRSRPFRLRLGGVACFERPEDGVYIDVEDLDGGYGRLRDEVLRPPFQRVASSPHVTLVHPRTSRRGREFWNGADLERRDREFRVAEVAITAFDGIGWVVLGTYALAGPPGDE
jgi:hypothetical protein